MQRDCMTREEIDNVFPYLLQEQDWQMPSMLAPQLDSSAPQLPNSLHPADQGAQYNYLRESHIHSVAGGHAVRNIGTSAVVLQRNL